MDGYTVGALARLSGVSVRTLHHYDEIGLLVPSGRTAAGYRLYDADDLGRLRQVLFYRELGFALDVIAKILAAPQSPSRTTCAASTGCCVSAASATARCWPRSNTRWRHGTWAWR